LSLDAWSGTLFLVATVWKAMKTKLAEELAVIITFDELRAKLETLEETRETARRELDALDDRRWRVADLERDRAALLEPYTEKASKGLDYFTPEDRHRPTRGRACPCWSARAGISRSAGCWEEPPALSKIPGHPGVPRGKGLKGRQRRRR
jgi:hypothetical protein